MTCLGSQHGPAWVCRSALSWLFFILTPVCCLGTESQFSAGRWSPSVTTSRWGALQEVVLGMSNALQEFLSRYISLRGFFIKRNQILCHSCVLNTGYCTYVCVTLFLPVLALLNFSREVLVASCDGDHSYHCLLLLLLLLLFLLSQEALL